MRTLLLFLLVLFSDVKGAGLSNDVQTHAEKVEEKLAWTLHRYLRSKFGDDPARLMLHKGLMITSHVSEMFHIHERMLLK